MMTETMKASGTLALGVEYNGEMHRDFVLRLPTVGDEIDASDADVPDSGFGVALMAACLEKLGTIPKENLTYDLLRGLLSEDYEQLRVVRDELKKKLKPESGAGGTSDTPASGSGDTATATKTSGG
ncbi:phage tail assembly protein [Enterobacter sp. PTB]|uniref:phage tail assembly protein n=1 Tax=Enterobacter sp. PTB TaxID=3143437 RepID=UPI003DAA2261